MKTEFEQRKRITSSPLLLAPAKMFAYPTRLMDAWKAGIMEINLPSCQLAPPEIEVSVREGSTQSLGIKPRSIVHKIYKRTVAPIQMNEEYIFDSRYEVDGNIAHLLHNAVPRLLVARQIYPKVTVILRANACTMARNVYKLLEFPVLCTDKEVYGKLILTSDSNHPKGNYEGLYKSLFGNLSFEGFNKQTPEKVFISRKGKRRLINENEIEQILQEYGFEKFYFEDIPISEQWSLARNAKFIVAMHGAALSSIVFNRNAAKVLELFHPGYVNDLYRRLTNALGGTWCGVTGQLTGKEIIELDFKHKGRKFALSSTRIDPTSLRMALQYLDTDVK